MKLLIVVLVLLLLAIPGTLGWLYLFIALGTLLMVGAGIMIIALFAFLQYCWDVDRTPDPYER